MEHHGWVFKEGFYWRAKCDCGWSYDTQRMAYDACAGLFRHYARTFPHD